MSRPVIQFHDMGMTASDVRCKFLGIYEAQFRGLEEAGVEVVFSEQRPTQECAVAITSPAPPFDGSIRRLIKKTVAPLVLYVPPADQWFNAALLKRIKHRLLFVYGTFSSAQTADRYGALGITYRHLPFGADPIVMRPLNLTRLYDVVFVGSLTHRRGWEIFIEPLMQRLGRRHSLFIGAGWEKYGIPCQSVAYGELLNLVYNLGRVCINFHSTEQKRGTRVQVDLNNRVFDLAAAGCVQVCDNAEGLQGVFTDDEVIAAQSPAAWVENVFRYLAAAEEEGARIRQKARERVLSAHTWRHRGETLWGWIRGALSEWKPCSQDGSAWQIAVDSLCIVHLKQRGGRLGRRLLRRFLSVQ